MLSFKIFLAIGFVVMTALMVYAGLSVKLPIWKILVSAVALIVAGVLGTKIMFFIENGGWSGRSFFGAVFFVPVLMFPVALLLKIRYGTMMDVCAPGVSLIVAVMKIDCIIEGCCYGFAMRYLEDGTPVRFPSQAVELVANLAITAALLLLHKKEKNQGLIYPWYLVIYGAVRFILNLFRETVPFVWILPAGNFWSLIAILIGGTVLLLHKAKAEQQRAKKKKPRRT